jgi:anthranilate synthase component 2
MIIIIDNYDSFTYNLLHLFQSLYKDILIFRNDEISHQELLSYNPKAIIISPGPGTPKDSGISLDVIKSYNSHKTPILGVCLGHQAIAEVYGAQIEKAILPIHGKSCEIITTQTNIFQGIPKKFSVVRYHSLIASNKNLPQSIIPTAWSDENEIMGLHIKNSKIYGVQFHPESILSQFGSKIAQNFLSFCSKD